MASDPDDGLVQTEISVGNGRVITHLTSALSCGESFVDTLFSSGSRSAASLAASPSKLDRKV